MACVWELFGAEPTLTQKGREGMTQKGSLEEAEQCLQRKRTFSFPEGVLRFSKGRGPCSRLWELLSPLFTYLIGHGFLVLEEECPGPSTYNVFYIFSSSPNWLCGFEQPSSFLWDSIFLSVK